MDLPYSISDYWMMHNFREECVIEMRKTLNFFIEVVE